MKEMNARAPRTRWKLRSARGASISYALLLFLVCSAVGAVVLVAATSAAGRLSGLAEADQRYYSVTSAAELLKEVFDGREETAVRMETSGVSTFYDFNGQESGREELPGTVSLTIGGKPADGGFTPDSLFSWAAYAMLSERAGVSFPATRSFTLEPGARSPAAAPGDLKVNGTATLKKDGTLVLELNSQPTGGAFGSGVYTLRMTFGADKRERETKREEKGTPQAEAGGYRILTAVTKTKTTAITWKFSGLETVASGH